MKKSYNNEKMSCVTIACHFEDLKEENEELRKERQELYNMINKQLEIYPTLPSIDQQSTMQIDEEKIVLQRQVERLSEDLDMQMNHNKDLANNNKTIQEKLIQNENDLHQAKIELVQILPLRLKLNDFKRKCEEYKLIVFNIRNENEIIKCQNETLILKNNNYINLNDELQHNLEVLTNEHSNLKTIKQDLDSNLLKFINHNKILQEEISFQKEKLINLDTQLLELSSECKHYERKSNSLSKELVKVQTSFSTYTTPHQITNILSEYEKENSNLKNQLQLQNETIQKLQNLQLNPKTMKKIIKNSSCFFNLPKCLSES